MERANMFVGNASIGVYARGRDKGRCAKNYSPRNIVDIYERRRWR
jgi:hypothetical protein